MYLPNFIDKKTEQKLADFIDDLPWDNELSRRVQHYGYKYDYKTRTLSAEKVDPIPDVFLEVLGDLQEKIPTANDEFKKLSKEHLKFTQVIVNEYEPGQGISPHIDSNVFGPVIVTLSLLSGVTMEFVDNNKKINKSMYLEPRSLLVMHGPSRTDMTHSIRKLKRDEVTSHNGRSLRVPRKRRISITYRTVINTKK